MRYISKGCFLMIGTTRPIITMFLIYMGYLVLGAVCFVTLEKSQEDKTREKTMETVREAEDMVAVLRTYNYSDKDIYDAFLNERRNLITSSNVPWMSRFAEKVHFSFILITSIGYGNVASTTNTGQIVTVLYTLVGIPLHFNVMRLLSVKFRGCLRKLFKTGQKVYPSSNLLVMTFGILFFLFWSTIFILLPAYVFTKTDDWYYQTGLYYNFVTLTTVGFGDYVAGVSHITSYYYFIVVIGLLVWMFFGLSFVFMAMNLFSYAMGFFILDKLDCKCKERAAARKKLMPLNDLVYEITFQLSKSKPEKFYKSDEIEKFKDVMTGNPENVTEQMLLKLFRITIELKETAYDHLSIRSTQIGHIQMTPAFQKAKDDLPSLDDLPKAPSSTIWPDETSEEISNDDDRKSNNEEIQDEEKRLVTDNARHVPYRGKHTSSRKTGDLNRSVQTKLYTIEENKKNRDNVENQEDVNKDNSTRRTSSKENENTRKTEDSVTTNVENQEDANKDNSTTRISSEENESKSKTEDNSTTSKIGKRSDDEDKKGEKR